MGTDTDNPGDYERAELRRLQAVFDAIEMFLWARRDAEELTAQEGSQISDAFVRAFNNAGLVGADHSRLGNAVNRQALHQMRAKIVELHPEWTESLDKAIQKGGRGI